jgi:hypothetical protein
MLLVLLVSCLLLDLAQLVQTGQWISGVLGRKAASRAGNAISARSRAG